MRWLEGDATSVTVGTRDAALLTGNTAQAIRDPGQWATTLQAIHTCLRPGGHLAFETRDPAARAWEQWTRAATSRVRDVPGTGEVESWVELTSVAWPLVSFRWTWVFQRDGATLTSSSTLRFSDQREVERDLHANDYEVLEVGGAPDRPDQELVFLAHRRERAGSMQGKALTCVLHEPSS